MGYLINLIAVIIGILSVLMVVADGAYLKLLDAVAKKRPGGQVTRQFVSKQWPIVGATGAGSVVALLLTSGGTVMDVLAILLAVGAGGAAGSQLGKIHNRYGKPNS